MRTPQNALVLVGSPKGGTSTSSAIGDYLLARLAEHGVEGRQVRVIKALRTEEGTQALLADVAAADLVILSFPLYVDSLPAPVTRALELIAAGRARDAGEPASFAAVVQCGFAEAEHNAVALEICRNFAAEAGFAWAGGLAMGEGGMIAGQPLEKIRGRVRNAVAALDLAATELAAGRAVPDEAVQLMAKPAFPPRMYRLMANMGWRSQRRKSGSDTPIDARPFA
jgi:NAD(P)H-dependent FMN reductase